MKRLYILIGLSLLQAQSEPINRANFRIDIAATNEEIVIDGERNLQVRHPLYLLQYATEPENHSFFREIRFTLRL